MELAKKSGAVVFTHNGREVSCDDESLICLTAMWEAAGRDESKRPYEWGRQGGAGFIEDLAKNLNTGKSRIWKSRRGKHKGGVWAHWQVALAYAKYLSHDFHRLVNEAFREWSEEKANPDLKAERAVEGYRLRGWDDRKIDARLGGIVQRKAFTGALKRHGVEGRGYAVCTDAINKKVLGASAREIRVARGAAPSASTRDEMTDVELAALRLAELMAEKKMDKSDAIGNQECRDICVDAGERVHQAVKSFGL